MIILNTISFILFLGAALVLVYRFWWKNIPIHFIIISFLLLSFVAFSNVLEWIDFAVWDEFENPVEILFLPLFIFSVYAFCLQYEVNENLLKEELIRDNSRRLSVAMIAAGEAYWEWDSKKKQIIIDKDNCYLSFDPESFVINRDNYREVLHSCSEDAVNILFRQFELEDKTDVNVELLVKKRIGGYYWLLFKGKTEEVKKRDYSIISYGTLIDISQYKSIQEEVIKSKVEAERSEKLKSAFLYNLSHEIRTPINGIIGFSQILQDEDLSGQMQKEYIKLITNSCFKLIAVVDDIVEISKIEVGDLSVIHRIVDVRQLIERLYLNYDSLANERGLEFKLKILSQDEDLKLFTDESKLYRSIENIIQNAIKFTKQGSVILGLDKSDESLIIFVEDTGIGIAKDDLEAVFDNFRQLEVSFNRRYGGSGLGLSISKGLIEALGGVVKIESEEGKGTRVSFVLSIDGNM
ncbi:MAG: hypothetical protein JW717_06160 [Marinilabiliaceae bacterium]|nr:hypothetical protein [Marinilabiliaceae bacterium]